MASGQPRVAGYVHGLHAHLANTAANNLADLCGVDPAALKQLGLHLTKQVDGMHGGQTPVSLTQRASDGFDDYYLAHGTSFVGGSSVTTGLDAPNPLSSL
jgi:hypothetical protein